MGEPRPMTPEDAAETVWKGGGPMRVILREIPLVLGGVVVFGAVFALSATTTMGATRSAKLRWQLRQEEIQKAIATSPPQETSASVAGAAQISPAPSVP